MRRRDIIEPSILDRAQLPPAYPTHTHPAAFWEALGRTIATFGHLEEVVARGLYALSGRYHVPGNNPEQDFYQWLQALDKSVRLTLYPLVQMLERDLREDGRFDDFDIIPLFDRLTRVTRIRNVLSHGSWRPPDQEGKSTLFHVDKTLGTFDTPIDLDFLLSVQAETADLCCDIMDMITGSGLPFSGKRFARLARKHPEENR